MKTFNWAEHGLLGLIVGALMFAIMALFKYMREDRANSQEERAETHQEFRAELEMTRTSHEKVTASLASSINALTAATIESLK